MPDGRIRSNPIWPIGLGAGLIVLGLICVYRVFLIPSDNVLLIGVLMLVAGVAEGLQRYSAGSGRLRQRTRAGAALRRRRRHDPRKPAIRHLRADPDHGRGVHHRRRLPVASSWREERMTGWHMLIVASVVSLLVWLVLLWTWPASARWVLGSVAAAGLFLTGYNWVKRGLAAREAHESI